MLRILLIIFLIYKILSTEIVGKIISVILPFLFGLTLSYTFYPLMCKLESKFSKTISIIIIVLLVILIILFLVYLVLPLFIKETNILCNIITFYINIIKDKYNINIANILNKIDFNNYIITGISISISYITNFILFFISFIYLLIDMDRIETKIKTISNKKIYNYLSLLNSNIRKYISSMFKISIISFFEYTLSFLVIGHSSPLLMGLISAITNMIPYIGSIFVLVIGILIEPTLIIKVSILYIAMGLVDSYMINPYIYGKYNAVPPILELFAITLGGALGGIKGIIISLPLVIILLTSVKYYKTNSI